MEQTTHSHSYSNLEDTNQFKNIIRNNTTENVLYIIDFHAQWCGPCKKIAPQFEELANKYRDHVMFFKCDVDEAQELSDIFSIESLPTFIFGYNRNIIDKFEGANVNKVEKKLVSFLNMEDRQFKLLSDNVVNQDDEENDDAENNNYENNDGETDGETDGENDDGENDDGENVEHTIVDDDDDLVENTPVAPDPPLSPPPKSLQTHSEQQDDKIVEEVEEVEEVVSEPKSIKDLKSKYKELQRKYRDLEKENKRLSKLLKRVKSALE